MDYTRVFIIIKYLFIRKPRFFFDEDVLIFSAPGLRIPAPGTRRGWRRAVAGEALGWCGLRGIELHSIYIDIYGDFHDD